MADTFRFQGGVAVITGAARGIGSGLVKTALSHGMRVVAADIEAGALAEMAQGLKGEILAVPTDVTKPAEVEALAAKAYEVYGRVDLLFNNAGVLAGGLSWEIEAERWRKNFDVNVFGIVHGMRSFVPRMLEAGTPAHIVNTASVGGFLAGALMSPYTATKFAVVAMTEALRAELEIVKAPIGVSVLAPGPVKTGIFNDPFGKQPRELDEKVMAYMRKLLTDKGLAPEEFGPLVFAAIQSNAFWIIPQPEYLDAHLRERTDDILARRTPRPVRY